MQTFFSHAVPVEGAGRGQAILFDTVTKYTLCLVLWRSRMQILSQRQAHLNVFSWLTSALPSKWWDVHKLDNRFL